MSARCPPLDKLAGVSVGPGQCKEFLSDTPLRLAPLTFVDGMKQRGKTVIMHHLRRMCEEKELNYVETTYNFEREAVMLKSVYKEHFSRTEVVFLDHPEIDRGFRPDSTDIYLMAEKLCRLAGKGKLVIVETKDERLISAATWSVVTGNEGLGYKGMAIILPLVEEARTHTSVFNIAVSRFGVLGRLAPNSTTYEKDDDLLGLPNNWRAAEAIHGQRMFEMVRRFEEDQEARKEANLRAEAAKMIESGEEKVN